MNKKAIILINVGTPDSPDKRSVAGYLGEFLGDGRVIDMPWLLRKILVNLIIVPFRAKRSASLYRLIWNENGSPLLWYSESLRYKLEKNIEGHDVYLAMRYGNPSLKSILQKINKTGYSEITFVPLYPQYASSTTGSVAELIFRYYSGSAVIPGIKILGAFYDHPLFINAFAGKVIKAGPENYDHIIFSFHGLPISHIKKIHPAVDITSCSCEKEYPDHGTHCYKAQCYETARLITSACNLDKNFWSVSFQSRLSKNWLSPFTDKILIEKAGSGIKKILLVAPSFVTDCLETLVELEIEYAELFRKHGGKELRLIHSLNDSDEWVDALKVIINESDKLLINDNELSFK